MYLSTLMVRVQQPKFANWTTMERVLFVLGGHKESLD